MRFRPFVDARQFVHTLGLKSQAEWAKYRKSGHKPSDIPSNPNRTYKNEWNGMGDWLGTGAIAPFEMEFRSFEEARQYVHKLGIKTHIEWINYCKSGKKPADIPAGPNSTYEKEWKSWGDWLGTGYIAASKKEYRPFKEAKQYVHSLHLKSQKEWRQYIRSGNKPTDIPTSVQEVYKKEWKGMGDWLGTENTPHPKKRYRSFGDARAFVHSLGLKSISEWKEYCKSGKRPSDIPSHPEDVYEEEWQGYGDWLRTGFIATQSRRYRSFEEAREFVHGLELKNVPEWREYCKSGKKPADIPFNPEGSYKKEWQGYGDWLGTGFIATQSRRYRSFLQAKEFARSLKLPNLEEWKAYCKSQDKPSDIPAAPWDIYKNDWNGSGDWLGTGYIANYNKEFKPFEEARQFVHSLGLKSGSEWEKYCQSGKKPNDIPSNPDKNYNNDWKGMGNWLGTGRISDKDRIFRSFEEAREFVHSLHLNSEHEWRKYCKSGKKPVDIPQKPSRTYKIEWKGMGDWLGTGYIATSKREFRPFEEAREFVHTLNLRNAREWEKYCQSGKKPKYIPSTPSQVYSEEWKGEPDWLGYEAETIWLPSRVKELLKGLIESRAIYEWDEAVLYSFLLRKGLLNLDNRHKQFFRNLIEASRTNDGKKAIEEYTNSDSENPPDLSRLMSMGTTEDTEQEIQSAFSNELTQLVKQEGDPLDYGKIKTAEQILANTNVLQSINVDEEAIQFYLDYSIDELWKSAFRDKENTIAGLKKEGKNGNRYHDTVVETFLSDYKGTQSIRVPNGYAFPSDPTLMQLYVAYKIKNLDYFGNFSGTGSGKTLSAVLASRVIDSKMTVIVCPNDIVEQWAKSIIEIFRDSKVNTGKDAFYVKYDENRHQYLVLNYDKFSQEDSPNLILTLAEQKVDFVILDEIHFVKKRDEESSQRRKNLDGLLTGVRKKNNQVKVLGLSATPVVNNLMEGRSLLELITGKIYDDIATKPTIPNAVTLYEKLSIVSIRELPQYNIDVDTEHIDVKAQKPESITIKELKSNPLTIERFLTDAKIPEIIKHIEDQTIIYTEYVTEIIEKLSNAVQDAGYSYALYTGSDHSGLKRFLDKKVQVLIASRPISTGVDGLQHICNRLIINTLPWTNAQYQQLLGRLVRKGQIRDVVHVYIIKADVSGYPYDQLKWSRIQFKRTLADCAVDGRLPEKNLVTPQQAAMEAVKWLERLERGEVSSIIRRDLEVELTPIEIEQRVRKYGDFTKLNNLINNEKSETTHERMLKDPKEWEEYHRQYREARKTWNIIPYEEIIKRIRKLSPRLQIGDFGCGEAKIMEAIGENRVYSFDHVTINDKVVACDMKKVPLADEALDVAIFSLSLMGKNWQEYITEAKRCLVTNGILVIAETTKSLVKGRLSNLRQIVKELGFEIYSDEERGDFTFIEAREL